MARCCNPNPTFVTHEGYFARGITVCDRWRDFDTFFGDMGAPPSREHSLDRVNNDNGYSPENCRWATRSEQCRNRRSNRRITAFGETLTLVEWCKRMGLTKGTIARRLRMGATPEEALAPRRSGKFSGWETGRRDKLTAPRTSTNIT